MCFEQSKQSIVLRVWLNSIPKLPLSWEIQEVVNLEVSWKISFKSATANIENSRRGQAWLESGLGPIIIDLKYCIPGIFLCAKENYYLILS